MAPLVYLSNARLPSEKANAFQSMQQCEAFGSKTELEFWYPRRRGNPLAAHDVFDYYDVSPTFRLRAIRCFDSTSLRAASPRAGFLTQALSFQAACVAALARPRALRAVYSRNAMDVFLVPAIRALRPRVGLFLEDHDGLLRRMAPLKRQLLKLVDGIVVTSSYHGADLIAAGVPEDAVLVAPNAVKVGRFSAPVTDTGRESATRVFYVGNLFKRKGVYTLVDAMSYLPAHFTLTVVGGSPELTPEFEAHIAARGLGQRVNRIGPVPPAEVPKLLATASLVVLPNSGGSDLSARLTSPLKLFEYMASRLPIVASDVPAVGGVLEHGRNAWLVPPDDPRALADGIYAVATDRDRGRRLAEAAFADAVHRSWDRRATRILEFITSRSGGAHDRSAT